MALGARYGIKEGQSVRMRAGTGLTSSDKNIPVKLSASGTVVKAANNDANLLGMLIRVDKASTNRGCEVLVLNEAVTFKLLSTVAAGTTNGQIHPTVQFQAAGSSGDSLKPVNSGGVAWHVLDWNLTTNEVTVRIS